MLDFEKTKIYWMNWCHKTPKFKNYNSEILRSAMTLKLLTFEKTGAVLAAATTLYLKQLERLEIGITDFAGLEMLLW